jgi:hypothetical protein
MTLRPRPAGPWCSTGTPGSLTRKCGLLAVTAGPFFDLSYEGAEWLGSATLAEDIAGGAAPSSNAPEAPAQQRQRPFRAPPIDRLTDGGPR